VKVTLLNKEETHKTRHFFLIVEVEDEGRNHRLNAILVENYDVRADAYTYEIENIGWRSDSKGVDVSRIQEKVEEYLIDNTWDILS